VSRISFIIIHFTIMFAIASAGYSQQNYFLTLSSTKARPIAMGSAFTAIEDNIAATSYNPAALSLYQSKKDYRLTFFLNPVGLSTMLAEQRQQNDNDQEHSNRALRSLSLLCKGIVFTGRFFDMAFVFNEQVIDRNTIFHQKQFFEDYDVWSNSYHTFATRVKFAEKVAIGAAASFYTKQADDVKLQGFGFSYGILLKPAPYLNIGLAFIDVPNKIPEIRIPLERIADQTMNIGVSFRPTSSTILSLDIRNLTEEQQKSVREAHFGFEQNLFSILSLRGGFFQEKFSNNRTYSAGFALFDSNLMFSKESHFDHPHFILNYAFIHQTKDTGLFNWHILTLLIRI